MSKIDEFFKDTYKDAEGVERQLVMRYYVRKTNKNHLEIHHTAELWIAQQEVDKLMPMKPVGVVSKSTLADSYEELAGQEPCFNAEEASKLFCGPYEFLACVKFDNKEASRRHCNFYLYNSKDNTTLLQHKMLYDPNRSMDELIGKAVTWMCTSRRIANEAMVNAKKR